MDNIVNATITEALATPNKKQVLRRLSDDPFRQDPFRTERLRELLT